MSALPSCNLSTTSRFLTAGHQQRKGKVTVQNVRGDGKEICYNDERLISKHGTTLGLRFSQW